MGNVICFRHPDYDGTSSPVLSCKTCCTLFLAELKKKNDNPVNVDQWLEDKVRMAKEAIAEYEKNNPTGLRFGFNPTTI